MNKAQFRRFTREYVRPLADDLGLRDWIIKVDRTDDDSLTRGSFRRLATSESCYGRKVATVTLYAGFFDLSPEEQKATLIHELLHCHFAGMQDIVTSDLLKHLGQQAYDVLYDSFIRSLEYAVDGIAAEVARLAKGIPLPPGEEA